MKFVDLTTITREGQPGVAYQSECGRWRVAASDLGNPPFMWCVWQRRRATWMQRLSWLGLASPEEAQAVAGFLERAPLSLSPRLLRDRLEWLVRRGATGALAYATAKVADAFVRRTRERVVMDLAGGFTSSTLSRDVVETVRPEDMQTKP